MSPIIQLAKPLGLLVCWAPTSNQSASSWSEVGSETVFGSQAGALGAGQFGQPVLDLLHIIISQDDGNQVRLGEIAVVVGLFLGAHGLGLVLGHVPEAGLLDHPFTFLNDGDLTLDLILDGLFGETEAVHVLDLGLGAELLGALRADRDVRVAPQGAFLHVAVRNADVEQDVPEGGQISMGLVRAADIRLGDDLDQGNAAAVVVG
jgi:hypothetical protein